MNVITRAHNANDATATTITGTGGGHHLTSKEEVLKGQTKRPIKANTGILEDLEGYVASKTKNRNVYVETYGCQMNVNDREVMMSVLNDNGFTGTIEDAVVGGGSVGGYSRRTRRVQRFAEFNRYSA